MNKDIEQRELEWSENYVKTQPYLASPEATLRACLAAWERAWTEESEAMTEAKRYMWTATGLREAEPSDTGPMQYVRASDYDALREELSNCRASQSLAAESEAILNQKISDLEGELAAVKAELTKARKNKIYSAPIHVVGHVGDVRIRFVSRDQIKDQPTEANPSPIRVVLMNELEQIKPIGIAEQKP